MPTQIAIVTAQNSGGWMESGAALSGKITEVKGGYLVRGKDFQLLDRNLKQLKDKARRLVGKRIVVEDCVVVTAYHAGTRKKLGCAMRSSAPCGSSLHS
jgi:hypothetical protein